MKRLHCLPALLFSPLAISSALTIDGRADETLWREAKTFDQFVTV